MIGRDTKQRFVHQHPPARGAAWHTEVDGAYYDARDERFYREAADARTQAMLARFGVTYERESPNGPILSEGYRYLVAGVVKGHVGEGSWRLYLAGMEAMAQALYDQEATGGKPSVVDRLVAWLWGLGAR